MPMIHSIGTSYQRRANVVLRAYVTERKRA